MYYILLSMRAIIAITLIGLTFMFALILFILGDRRNPYKIWESIGTDGFSDLIQYEKKNSKEF